MRFQTNSTTTARRIRNVMVASLTATSDERLLFQKRTVGGRHETG
jgi:hypothetical protein